MNLFQMKCPNCGADLDIEDGIDSFFCKYCGTKIVLEGQSDAAIKAKSKAKTLEQLNDMHKNYLKYRQAEKKRKAEEDAKRRKEVAIVGIVCFLLAFGICLFMMYTN